LDSAAKARTSPAGIASVLIGGGQIVGYPIYGLMHFTIAGGTHTSDLIEIVGPFILPILGIALALASMRRSRTPSYAAHLGLAINVTVFGFFLVAMLAMQY
jgi:hypothetical protein